METGEIILRKGRMGEERIASYVLPQAAHRRDPQTRESLPRHRGHPQGPVAPYTKKTAAGQRGLFLGCIERQQAPLGIGA